MSIDFVDLISRIKNRKEKYILMLNFRKKSMFLLDFLSIGRDLINNREKNKDKETDKDRLCFKSLELISLLIDEEVILLIFVDG